MAEPEDDSVALFNAETQRTADAGGLRRVFLRQAGLSLLLPLGALLWLAILMTFGRFLPREADGVFTTGSLVVISVVNLILAAILWRFRSRNWRFTAGAWISGGASVLLLVAGAVDRAG